MTKHTLLIDGIEVPCFFYGTAWKEERTQDLTELAIACGFRGIDTANQRRHYDEAAVGRAIAASIAKGVVGRDDSFLQTKFTFRPGQDHRPRAPAGGLGGLRFSFGARRDRVARAAQSPPPCAYACRSKGLSRYGRRPIRNSTSEQPR